MNSQRTKLVDEGDLRKYRIELPNMLDDADLDPYEFRLYAHLKRRAGDGGYCNEGARRIAEVCKMSLGKVVAAKQALAAKGFIRIKPGDPATSTPDTIFITNIWARNFEQYAPCSQDEHPPVHDVNTPVHEQPPPRSPDEHPVHETEHKKEPREERTKKEETKTESEQERANALLDSYFETVGRDPTKVHPTTLGNWRKLIINRLRESWTDDQIRLVWLGCKRDNWPDRPKFSAVSDLLGDPKKIDHFINLATIPERTTGNGKKTNETRVGPRTAQLNSRDYTIFPRRE